jgi:hypothetical protein
MVYALMYTLLSGNSARGPSTGNNQSDHRPLNNPAEQELLSITRSPEKRLRQTHLLV